MSRVGKVVDVKDDLAIVTLKANAACGGCEACSNGTDDTTKTYEVLNTENAKVGDFVEFDMEIPTLLGAAFIAYTIPLLTMVLSILLSIAIFKQMGIEKYELFASVIGFLTLFLTFFTIKKYDKKMNKSRKFLAKVTRIVKSYQEVCLNDEERV